MNRYTYASVQRNDIPLVYLQPPLSDQQDEDADITISIEARVVKLGECRYSALSYVWGDSNRSEDLEVQDSGFTRTLKMTKSLQTALEQLRSSETKVLLIDGICINQDNLDERSKQVTRMSDIYSKASNVIIWVGESDYDSDMAMKLIPGISVRDLDRLVGNHSTGESWRALPSLMRRPWFGRRWIIQELAFAQKAELQCGSLVVSWTQFSEAVTLFESKLDDINRLFRELSNQSG